MSLQKAAERVRRAGRENDTELVHLTKGEVKGLKGLAAAAGGELTRNPDTGLLEAGFLQNMLPTILGAAAMMIPGMQPLGAAAIGAGAGAMTNKQDPLMGAMMGGLGAFGGAGVAEGLTGMGASQVAPEALAAANASADPIMAVTAAKDAAMASGVAAPTGLGAMQAGLQNSLANPQGLATTMGGTVPALKTAGMAAAPMFYEQMQPGEEWKPKEEKARNFRYDANYTGGTQVGPDASSERQWFDPTFTPMAEGGKVEGQPSMISAMKSGARAPQAAPAQFVPPAGLPKGLAGAFLSGRRMSERTGGGQGADRAYLLQQALGNRYAHGGAVQLSEGGFVFPADVVSMVGNGSSNAGLETLAKTFGAQPLDGPGDGLSDDIPAHIDGRAPARVARQEAYLPPEQVARAGGAKRLYALMDRVRKQAHGHTQQQRPVRLEEAFA